MDARKLKVMEEILEHLSDSQARGLKSRLDESKRPVMEEGDELDEEGKPAGVSVEKVEVLGAPKKFDDKVEDAIGDEAAEKGIDLSSDEEMTEDELKELLSQLID